MLAKSFEWPDRHPVRVFASDVLMAFDHMRPEDVYEVYEPLIARGAHPRTVAASAKENCELRMTPIFKDALTDPVQWLRLIRNIKVNDLIDPVLLLDMWLVAAP